MGTQREPPARGARGWRARGGFWASAPSFEEDADPRDILSWAARAFAGKIAASCSFKTQSVPLLHMISELAPEIPILFLDTGFHFPETLAFRDRLVREWNLDLRLLRADREARAALSSGNIPPYQRNPDRCCWINKVEPMRQAFGVYEAWISGVRRDQTSTRSGFQVVDQGPDNVIRIHPVLFWTSEDVERYIREHDLPAHPLTANGYASIGCEPCTRRPKSGEDERSGRWSGLTKTECGLHVDVRETSRSLPVLQPRAEE